MARKNRKSDPADPVSAEEPKNLTPIDIQQKESSVAARPFRGYDEQEVDAFLARVTEEMARLHADNRRLQEDAELRRTVPLDGASAVEAERLLREAREEAARIVAEARAQSRGGSAESGPRLGMLDRLLGRERAVPQGLGPLI